MCQLRDHQRPFKSWRAENKLSWDLPWFTSFFQKGKLVQINYGRKKKYLHFSTWSEWRYLGFTGHKRKTSGGQWCSALLVNRVDFYRSQALITIVCSFNMVAITPKCCPRPQCWISFALLIGKQSKIKSIILTLDMSAANSRKESYNLLSTCNA